MKTIIKFSLLTIFAICLYVQASAQDYLSEQQKRFIERRAAQKTGQLNNYIAYMVDVDKSQYERSSYMQSAKDLFLGRADEYYEEGYEKIAKMQVTSTSRPDTVYPVRDYFKHLVRLLNRVYDRISIVATKIDDMQVSRLYHLYDNVYECSVAYVQLFCGYRDGRAIYCDRTKKVMKCRVYLVNDQDGGFEIEVYLSECRATETERIKPRDINNSNSLIPDR